MFRRKKKDKLTIEVDEDTLASNEAESMDLVGYYINLDVIKIRSENLHSFGNWIKEVLKVKKYQKLAEKYFLEFEFKEDTE